MRQCFYSVPVRYAGMRIDVRLGAETVEALDGARVVARHPRAVGKGVETLDLDHYLETLAIKPGALAGATRSAPGPGPGPLQQLPRPLLRAGPTTAGRARRAPGP